MLSKAMKSSLKENYYSLMSIDTWLIISLFVFVTFGRLSVGENLFLLFTILLSGGLFAIQIIKKNVVFNKFLYGSTGLFLLLILLSSLSSPPLFWSILTFIRWLSAFLIFLFVLNFASSQNKQRMLFWVILTSGLLAAIYSMYVYYRSEVPIERLKMGGVFLSYTYWAGFLLLLFPLAFVQGLGEREKKKKAILWVISLLFIVSIILTRARASWVSLLPTLLLVLLFFRKRIKEYAFFSLSLFLVSILFASFFSSPRLLVGRFESLFLLNNPQKAAEAQGSPAYDTAFIHRQSLWKNALKIVKDHPFLGVGPSNFGLVYHKYQTQPWLFARYAHNSYLELLAEAGILGFISFLVLLMGVLYLAKESLRQALEDPCKNGYTLALFFSLFAFLTAILFDSHLQHPTMLLYFFAILGLFLSFSKSEKDFRELQVSRLFKGALSGLLLGVIVVSFIFYLSVTYYQKATTRYSLKRYSEAEVLYKRALQLNPFQSFSYEKLGLIAKEKGNLTLAEEYFKKGSRLDPLRGEFYLELGIIQSQMGNYDEAEKSFQTCLDISSYTTPRYYNAFAKFYLEQGKKQEAIKIYESSVEHFPLNEIYSSYRYLYKLMDKHIVESYFQLAELYRAEGNEQQAKELIEQVLEKVGKTGSISFSH